jgi:hypothetical protein
VKIIAVARVNFVGANRNVDINVTLWATGETNLALSRELQTQTVFNSGGYVQVEGSPCSHATLAATAIALIGNHLTEASTSPTGLRGHDIAQERTNLTLNRTGASTDIANARRSAWAAAGSAAGFAQDCGVDFDRLGRTENNFIERHFNTDECILPAFCAASRAASLAAAKEGVEDVTEAKATHSAKWVLPAHVVFASLIWVAEHFVGMSNRLEPLLCLGGIIHVRVQLASQPAIGLFDLIVCGISRYAECFVMVRH